MPKTKKTEGTPVISPLVIEMWPIDRPIDYEKNPRKISMKAVDKVAHSIRKYGFRQPMVCDENDIILIGHTRRMAARKLGYTEVPVHPAHGMSEADKKGLRIADNRTNEEAEWDEKLLGIEIRDLSETIGDLDEATGFEIEEIEALLGFKDEGDNGEESESPGDPGEDRYSEQYAVIVACDDEAAQEKVYTDLTAAGYNCKVVNT